MFGSENKCGRMRWIPILAALGACATAQKTPVEGGVIAPGFATDSDVPNAMVFHHSELIVVSRAEPTVPEDAQRLKTDERFCRVRTYINTEGIPWKAVARDCPTVLVEPAETCMLQWRFEPPRTAKGEVVSASAVYRVVF